LLSIDPEQFGPEPFGSELKAELLTAEGLVAGRNSKWFDKPFDRLTVLSRAEGLTTLSQVEGQIQNTNFQMFKTGHDHLY